MRVLALLMACAGVLAPASVAADQSAAHPPFVQVRGRDLVTPDGRVLVTRGMNLGNWLVPEGYMFRFEKGAASPRHIEQVIAGLVGPDEARAFWRTWRDTYVTRDDLALLKRMGFDTVRLPFSYRLFLSDDDPSVWKADGFEPHRPRRAVVAGTRPVGRARHARRARRPDRLEHRRQPRHPVALREPAEPGSDGGDLDEDRPPLQARAGRAGLRAAERANRHVPRLEEVQRRARAAVQARHRGHPRGRSRPRHHARRRAVEHGVLGVRRAVRAEPRLHVPQVLERGDRRLARAVPRLPGEVRRADLARRERREHRRVDGVDGAARRGAADRLGVLALQEDGRHEQRRLVPAAGRMGPRRPRMPRPTRSTTTAGVRFGRCPPRPERC